MNVPESNEDGLHWINFGSRNGVSIADDNGICRVDCVFDISVKSTIRVHLRRAPVRTYARGVNTLKIMDPYFQLPRQQYLWLSG